MPWQLSQRMATRGAHSGIADDTFPQLQLVVTTHSGVRRRCCPPLFFFFL